MNLTSQPDESNLLSLMFNLVASKQLIAALWESMQEIRLSQTRLFLRSDKDLYMQLIPLKMASVFSRLEESKLRTRYSHGASMCHLGVWRCPQSPILSLPIQNTLPSSYQAQTHYPHLQLLSVIDLTTYASFQSNALPVWSCVKYLLTWQNAVSDANFEFFLVMRTIRCNP